MSNMVVRTNVFALNAHRNMANVGRDQQTASNRLSSGFRINSAADDAAGLAISEGMRAQIRGLDQASRNTQDGQSMILTTEGGLEEISNMLQRTRELLVQASNDTNTQDQRHMIDQEIGQLGREIASMQQRVEFNTSRVLAMGPNMTGSVVKASGQMAVGAANLQTWASELQEARDATLGAMALINELDSTAVASTVTGTQGMIISMAFASRTMTTALDGAYTGAGSAAPITVAATAGFTGAAGRASMMAMAEERLASIDSRLASIQAQAGAMDTLLRTNYLSARNFATFRTTENTVGLHTGAAAAANTGNNVAFFQAGANSNQGIFFDFETVSRTVSTAASVVGMVASAVSAPASGSGIGNGIAISPMISMIDSSIEDVSRIRANLGAVSNRMDFTQRSLDISSENLQDAESRVRNTDVAREMMRFSMANVLQQASVSMLAQANQMPNNLLQLLR